MGTCDLWLGRGSRRHHPSRSACCERPACDVQPRPGDDGCEQHVRPSRAQHWALFVSISASRSLWSSLCLQSRLPKRLFFTGLSCRFLGGAICRCRREWRTRRNATAWLRLSTNVRRPLPAASCCFCSWPAITSVPSLRCLRLPPTPCSGRLRSSTCRSPTLVLPMLNDSRSDPAPASFGRSSVLAGW